MARIYRCYFEERSVTLDRLSRAFYVSGRPISIDAKKVLFSAVDTFSQLSDRGVFFEKASYIVVESVNDVVRIFGSTIIPMLIGKVSDLVRRYSCINPMFAMSHIGSINN